WDPMAMDEVRGVFGDRISYAGTADACLRRSDVVVVANPLPELAAVDWSLARHATVVDCWRCLPPEAGTQAGRYVALGRGPATDVACWLDRVAGDYFRLLTA